MLRHPLAINLAQYAAEYAKKNTRTLSLLLDSNLQVIRNPRLGETNATYRESVAKYRLLMDELHRRAELEDSSRRIALIERCVLLSRAELTDEVNALRSRIDREEALGTRQILRERLRLAEAEWYSRSRRQGALPERDECGPEDDD